MGGTGTAIYREGMSVSEDIAKAYPQFIEGHKEAKVKHDPSLSPKLTGKEIAGMSEAKLRQWIAQFFPAAMPARDADKASLVELVTGLTAKA
jgi:hypothetical protein